MPRPDFRATFENGEVSPDWLRRADTANLPRACRRARNVLLKAAGGALRRPGSSLLNTLTAQCRTHVYRGIDVTEELVFSNGRLDVYATDGTLNQSITSSVPWTTAQLSRLTFAPDKNKVFVFHEEFVPQVLTRASDGTWSRADYAFLTAISSNPAQPYYADFDDIDVTMSLTHYSGSGRTMTFSANVLQTDGSHVGVRFRYLTKCEVEITAVTDAQTATVTIHDTLYPTLTVTVGDSSGYKVGQVVEGSISQVRGLVSAVPTGTTVRVVLLDGYEYFEVITTTGLDKDRLVGPEASQEITGVASYATPAATSIWDEQLLSDARGYPRTGVIHRRRLFLAGFPEAPNAIVASSVGNFYDFTIGVDDAAAINEPLGDDPNAEIRHLVSTEQLLVMTDRGQYYVPESNEVPITPETIQYLSFAPEGAGYAIPVRASEGVLFIDEASGRLMAAIQTGNVRRSWDVVEMSEQWDHLLNSPVRLAVAHGLDGRTERYVFVLNGDGTLVVMVYRRGSDVVGATLWSRGSGTWTDVVSIDDDVYVVSNISSSYRLSRFDFSALTDDETSYASAVTGYNGVEVELVFNKCVVVTETVASGEVPSQSPDSDYSLGIDFAVELQPSGPMDEFGWRRRRLPRTTVEVQDSGAFYVNGVASWPFTGGQSIDDIGALTSRAVRVSQLGWANESYCPITQPKGEGAVLDVLAVTMEVS